MFSARTREIMAKEEEEPDDQDCHSDDSFNDNDAVS